MCKLGSTAPLLARLRFVWFTEAALEFVDCDQRLRLFRPSLSRPCNCSEVSTATLCLRLCSWRGAGSPFSRRAISDVSLGLCVVAGTAELLAPVLVELSEPVRLIVTTDADETEFEREE